MNEEIIKTLKMLGFSPQESEIYLTILALGTPSVTEIAKKISRARNAVYFHIRNLKEKGLVSETRIGKRQHYVALPPTEFVKKITNITTEFESFIPQIKILNSLQRETPIIEITESRQGYIKIYKEISLLPNGSVFRVMEGKQALELELGILTQNEWKSFFSTIVKKGISTKAIFTSECKKVPPRFLSKENQELLTKRFWELKTISNKTLAMQQLMYIYNDKVAFLFPNSSLVVTISHKGIADILAASFDALYSLAGKKDVWS